ncbi:ABC transporter ATP-binding protein [Dehalococcoidia bacterium]|nr:ABC transporter ATP-binding protein [Dehalococcoidia bacterium]
MQDWKTLQEKVEHLSRELAEIKKTIATSKGDTDEEKSARKLIEVRNLHKYYKEVRAVDGVSFDVYEGEIFGMVGPNGAGKTTTIECIEGLRKPHKGSISVLGLKPWRDGHALRLKIGMQLQEGNLFYRITVKEAFKLYATFYPQPASWREMLKKFGLEDKQDVYYEKLSGGLKQRLTIALALMGKPRVVFFDELTTGLDPQARRNMWGLIREIRARGTTVFLTTHSMEEAQELCDRVCIIEKGKIVALDKPEVLIQSLQIENKVIFSATDTITAEMFGNLPGVSKVEKTEERIIIYGNSRELLTALIQTAGTQAIPLPDLQIKQPTLEDVYLTLTGRDYRD